MTLKRGKIEHRKSQVLSSTDTRGFGHEKKQWGGCWFRSYIFHRPQNLLPFWRQFGARVHGYQDLRVLQQPDGGRRATPTVRVDGKYLAFSWLTLEGEQKLKF